jgi:hypothetical protein
MGGLEKGRKDVGFNGNDPEGGGKVTRRKERKAKRGRRWKSTKGKRAARLDDEKVI